MAPSLYLDPTTFQLIQFGTEENPSILCENFDWLVNNLKNFETSHTTQNDKWPLAGRGKRRIERGKDSEGLGYTYKAQSIWDMYHKYGLDKDLSITKQGVETIEGMYGYPFDVEIWKVDAEWPIKDVAKGEKYFGKEIGKTVNRKGNTIPLRGGGYTCKITSRFDLKNLDKSTRYYVACDCADFLYSFKQDLQDAGYTSKSEILPKRKNKGTDDKNPIYAPHAAAICKHIYAVLLKFYGDFIAMDYLITDPNPERLGLKGSEPEPEPIVPEPESIGPEQLPVFKDSFSNYTAHRKSQDQLQAAINCIKEKLGSYKKTKENTTSARPTNEFKHLVDNTSRPILDSEVIRIEQELEIRKLLTQQEIKKAERDNKKKKGKAEPIVPVKDLNKHEVKFRARSAIVDALMDADLSLDSNHIDSYEDTRKFSKGKAPQLKLHKYKFEVRVETPTGEASIYYMNPTLGGSSSGMKVVTVPNYGKKESYYLFTPNELRQLIINHTTPMPDSVTKQMNKLKKKQVVLFTEECEISYTEEMQILQETSNIKRSILQEVKRCQ